MLKPTFTKQFERDLKKILKRGKNKKKIKYVISKLINQELLEAKYKDHKIMKVDESVILNQTGY